MKRNNHDELDLLKLDIVNSECAVLESIIEDNLKVKVILVEFSAVDFYSGGSDKALRQTFDMVNKLMKFHYKIINVSENFHYIFLRNDVYEKLAN